MLKIEKSILKKFWNDVEAIPVFCDTFNIQHNICRNKSKSIFNILCVLFEPNFFNNNYIYNLFIEVLNVIDDIMDVEESQGIFYYKYTIELFEYYLNKCVDGEIYEQAANIKKFLDINKNNTNTNEE